MRERERGRKMRENLSKSRDEMRSDASGWLESNRKNEMGGSRMARSVTCHTRT